MALWSGRFQEQVGEFTQRFGASLPVDKKMYAEDIAGSLAHSAMLAQQGVISAQDAEAIAEGLAAIRGEIEAEEFPFDINNEDIHMSIESVLTQRIGDAGKRLHTGRSRNDQVATDTRLYMKKRAGQLMEANLELRRTLLEKAQQHPDAVMPGYTHLQHAQPVLFSHHLMAYTWMLARDFERLAAARKAADANPLGAAALAGTTYPLDRFATTQALGFARPIPNSLDAVSDRDFLLDLIYACSVSCLHLSRLCEEIILWSTAEFGFITLSDAYSTGSSIMPQKKNPDFAELIRGKSGRVVGDLMALMMTLKSLPLAYNKGLPFRRAHEVVGRLVLRCEQQGCDLEDLALADFQAESDLFEADIASCLNLEAIVAARTTYGGTGHAAVREQLTEVKASLAADHTRL